MENQNTSQICLIAKKIYAIWKEEGGVALGDYFSDEMAIPEEHARVFAEKYHPEKPPADVCPIEAYTKNWKSSKVFSELSLQLPSINNPDGVWPKNILAWWILRYIYGSDVFDFQIEGTGKMGDNRIDFPARFADNNGAYAPFGLAAIEAVEFESVPSHVVRKSRRLQEKLGRDVGLALTQALLKADFIFPPDKTIDQLSMVVQEGLGGKEVIIVGTFCPDYSYEATGDPIVPYRYTFQGVGGGVGLVAQQIQRVLPCLMDFFEQHDIECRLVLSIADFEANSQEILEQVGLTHEEFVSRCLASLDEFHRSLSGIPMELRLFEREWANGRWNRYVVECYEQMKAGDYGHIQSNTGKNPYTEVVKFTAKASRKFYCDWYGRDMTDEELQDLVIRQGAEYAAMGRVLAEDFFGQPFIQVAGDRAKMQAFSSMHSKHPTICTKRVY